jgi:hypothetical protein
MNINKIYSDLVTPQGVKDEQEAKQNKTKDDTAFTEGLIDQSRKDWLDTPHTKVLVLTLEQFKSKLLDMSIEASTSTYTEEQKQQQQARLIIAKTISSILNNIKTGKY